MGIDREGYETYKNQGDMLEQSRPFSVASEMPPLTRRKVIHCSYHYWHPMYRSITPKARLVPLTDSFIEYLHADGIVLPQDDSPVADRDDSWTMSEGYDDEEEGLPDPSKEWPEIHAQVKAILSELGGSVCPKLNWSTPTDAKHMIPTNRLECKTASDVYLVLKSSRLIANDLDDAFRGCLLEQTGTQETNGRNGNAVGFVGDNYKIPYHLVLRKYLNVNPALEFRCFVRSRRLVCICQRSFKFYDWLLDIKDKLRQSIQTFFDKNLRDTFPDPDFVFDVYVPQDRVWLTDIGTFSQNTNPLHFTWDQILDMEKPDDGDSRTIPEEQVRHHGRSQVGSAESWTPIEPPISSFQPVFVLAEPADPGTATYYSLINEDRVPQDVLDATETPGAMAGLLSNWKEALERSIKADQEYESDSDSDSEVLVRDAGKANGS